MDDGIRPMARSCSKYRNVPRVQRQSGEERWLRTSQGSRDGRIYPAPDTPMIRTHWRSIACAMAALLAASSASAQRVTLRGQVVDAASGQPVPAAVVEVMPRRETAVTDAQGRFTLRTTM